MARPTNQKAVVGKLDYFVRIAWTEWGRLTLKIDNYLVDKYLN